MPVNFFDGAVYLFYVLCRIAENICDADEGVEDDTAGVEEANEQGDEHEHDYEGEEDGEAEDMGGEEGEGEEDVEAEGEYEEEEGEETEYEEYSEYVNGYMESIDTFRRVVLTVSH